MAILETKIECNGEGMFYIIIEYEAKSKHNSEARAFRKAFYCGIDPPNMDDMQKEINSKESLMWCNPSAKSVTSEVFKYEMERYNQEQRPFFKDELN